MTSYFSGYIDLNQSKKDGLIVLIDSKSGLIFKGVLYEPD